MDIAITVRIISDFWSSGLNQNALYLGMMLKKMGHDISLIAHGENENAKQMLTEMDMKFITINESLEKSFDIVFGLGFTVEKTWHLKWKSNNNAMKLVAYNCGNAFLTDSENMLFNAHPQLDDSNIFAATGQSATPDQIWSIPQMENSNLEYYKFLSGQSNATVVPFIWNPFFTNFYMKQNNISGWSRRRKIKRVGVMEPNISMFKHLLMPMVIVSNYLNAGGELEALHLFSSDTVKESSAFKKVLNIGRLTKRLNMTSNGRLPTMYVLDKHIDIILSWQWENPLNYLYLDAAWHGFPVVHNAHMCKDIGYYYDGFDASSGAEILNYAIDNHNMNTSYERQMRDKIRRYTDDNPSMLKDYEVLLRNLINDNFKRFRYDHMTNSIY